MDQPSQWLEDAAPTPRSDMPPRPGEPAPGPAVGEPDAGGLAPVQEGRNDEIAPMRRSPKATPDEGPAHPAALARENGAPAPPVHGGPEDRSLSPPRPIQRHDVYRHRVVGGREVRDTVWRRLLARGQELLTSRAEREEAALDERLRRPPSVSRMNVIAVVSPKGGVGKTTTTWLVGDAMANLGRLAVCAIDANPDYGTLGSLVDDARRSDRTLADLLSDHEGQDAPDAAALSRYLSAQPSGLRVLEAPSNIDVMARMGAGDYERLLELVRRQIATVILDCGTGLASPVARWAMSRADQVLIVTTPDWVTSNNVSGALRHVPADRATLVLNQVRSGVAGDRQAIADHFAAQAVEQRLSVPYDEQLRTMLDSSTYELSTPRRPTRLAIKRLAAQVQEGLQ